MPCLFAHDWSWPRQRGERDLQVCLRCGSERQSKIQFGGPRYRRTQEGFPGLVRPGPRLVLQVKGITALSSVA